VPTHHTDIDGLVAIGDRTAGYRLHAVLPGGDTISILPATVRTGNHDHPQIRPLNHFRTLGDARAAAYRIRRLLPWGEPSIVDAVHETGCEDLRLRLHDQLLGCDTPSTCASATGRSMIS
jgi:hypothetical protein